MTWTWAVVAGLGLAGVGPRAGHAAPPQPQQAAREVDDAELAAEVRAQMSKGSGGSSINVKSKHGVVTLTGAVDSRAQRQEAEDAAQRISGVKSVKNDLKVNLDAPSP